MTVLLECLALNKKRDIKKMEDEKMNNQKPRDTPEIVVPKGYELTDLIDTDDSGYGFENEAIYTGEVSVKVGR